MSHNPCLTLCFDLHVPIGQGIWVNIKVGLHKEMFCPNENDTTVCAKYLDICKAFDLSDILLDLFTHILLICLPVIELNFLICLPVIKLTFLVACPSTTF